MEDVDLFNHQLDQLIRTHHLPTEEMDSVHREMLGLAQALSHKPFISPSNVQVVVRKLVTQESVPSSSKVISKRKLLALGLLLPIAAFIVACAVSPTIRTRTREVLLQIGNLIFTNKPTNAQRAEPYMNTPWPTPLIEETIDPQRWAALTQEDANRLVGFQVLVPHDVPEQEWEKAFRPDWGNPKEISWEIYESPAGGIYVLCDCFRFHQVAIGQQRVEEGKLEEFAVADAQLSEVQVRGTRGYWIVDAPTGIVGGGGSAWSLTRDDIVWQVSQENYLVWVENGILYMISGSDELSLDDFQLVAESLAP